MKPLKGLMLIVTSELFIAIVLNIYKKWIDEATPEETK